MLQLDLSNTLLSVLVSNKFPFILNTVRFQIFQLKKLTILKIHQNSIFFPTTMSSGKHKISMNHRTTTKTRNTCFISQEF